MLSQVFSVLKKVRWLSWLYVTNTPFKIRVFIVMISCGTVWLKILVFQVPLAEGKDGCFQVCFCDELGKLTRCKKLACVQTKACFIDGQYRGLFLIVWQQLTTMWNKNLVMLDCQDNEFYNSFKVCLVVSDDNTQFHIDCNFCSCFDAERICTRRHCNTSVVVAGSSTGNTR